MTKTQGPRRIKFSDIKPGMLIEISYESLPDYVRHDRVRCLAAGVALGTNSSFRDTPDAIFHVLEEKP